MSTISRVGPPLPEGWADLSEAFYREWEGLYDSVASALFAEFPDRPPPCPWELEGLTPEHFTRQIICYWALDRADPASGKTPLREWVDRRVADPRLREALLWTEHPRVRDVVVRGSIAPDRVGVEDLESGERFQLWITPDRRELLVAGTEIHGAIHRWGRDWRLNGISQIRVAPDVANRWGLIGPSDVEDLVDMYLRREASRIDDKILRSTSPLTSVLAGYPVEWVDRICQSLGFSLREKKRDRIRRISAHLIECPPGVLLEGVSAEGRDALRWLLDRGGVVSRGALRKQFPLDGGDFWHSGAVDGPVSALRGHGLVVFGRVPDSGGRLLRTALVPAEIRARLAVALGPPRGTELSHTAATESTILPAEGRAERRRRALRPSTFPHDTEDLPS